jgi:hypothetical protein
MRPPDPVGRKTRRVEGVVALRDNRAGFEPFRACGIADALPNLTRAAATTGGFAQSFGDAAPTERLKTGAGELNGYPHHGRAEFFAPPGQGASTGGL